MQRKKAKQAIGQSALSENVGLVYSFQISAEDAEKLLAILEENAEYQPDYFGSLYAAVLVQYAEQFRAKVRFQPYREECSQ